MTFKELLTKHGVTQAYIVREFEIPRRTVEDWASGKRNAAEYLLKMLDELLDLRGNK